MSSLSYEYPFLNVIRREKWGALPSKAGVSLEPISHPVSNVIFTYNTNTQACDNPESCKKTIKELQKKYLDEGHPDLPYNFLVGGDNNIYEARGWAVKPVKHDKFPQFHDSSVELAYIGNFNHEVAPLAMGIKAMELVKSGIHHNLICLRYEIHEDGEDIDIAEILRPAEFKAANDSFDENETFLNYENFGVREDKSSD